METIMVELTNSKALGILQELEDLHLIKLLRKNTIPAKQKLSDKYRGILSKKDGKRLSDHIDNMRNEWNNT
jgi:hypothetical protein